MTKAKWLCVVNLVGIHGPLRATRGMGGTWVTRSGMWSVPDDPRRRVKDGARFYLYDTKTEAQCWVDGARAVANQVRSLCK